jgi:hypothetical protein
VGLTERIRHAPWSVGDLVLRDWDINYMKRIKAYSNYDTKQCKKPTIQRMAFKETVLLFAAKESQYKKLQRQKRSCVKYFGVPL